MVTFAIKPAQKMPFMPNNLEPTQAKGTYKTSILTTENTVEGYGLFKPLKLEALSITNPWNP